MHWRHERPMARRQDLVRLGDQVMMRMPEGTTDPDTVIEYGVLWVNGSGSMPTHKQIIEAQAPI
jgi:hypothetical protein